MIELDSQVYEHQNHRILLLGEVASATSSSSSSSSAVCSPVKFSAEQVRPLLEGKACGTWATELKELVQELKLEPEKDLMEIIHLYEMLHYRKGDKAAVLARRREMRTALGLLAT